MHFKYLFVLLALLVTTQAICDLEVIEDLLDLPDESDEDSSDEDKPPPSYNSSTPTTSAVEGTKPAIASGQLKPSDQNSTSSSNPTDVKPASRRHKTVRRRYIIRNLDDDKVQDRKSKKKVFPERRYLEEDQLAPRTRDYDELNKDESGYERSFLRDPSNSATKKNIFIFLVPQNSKQDEGLSYEIHKPTPKPYMMMAPHRNRISDLNKPNHEMITENRHHREKLPIIKEHRLHEITKIDPIDHSKSTDIEEHFRTSYGEKTEPPPTPNLYYNLGNFETLAPNDGMKAFKKKYSVYKPDDTYFPMMVNNPDVLVDDQGRRIIPVRENNQNLLFNMRQKNHEKQQNPLFVPLSTIFKRPDASMFSTSSSSQVGMMGGQKPMYSMQSTSIEMTSADRGPQNTNQAQELPSKEIRNRFSEGDDMIVGWNPLPKDHEFEPEKLREGHLFEHHVQKLPLDKMKGDFKNDGFGIKTLEDDKKVMTTEMPITQSSTVSTTKKLINIV